MGSSVLIIIIVFTCAFLLVLGKGPIGRQRYNVQEVLHFLDGSDIEDYPMSDDENSESGEEDYQPIEHDSSANRTATLTDESSSDENVDDCIPVPSRSSASAAICSKTREYIWKKTDFETPDTTYLGGSIRPNYVQLPLEYFMNYITTDIFNTLAFETNHYTLFTSGASIHTTAVEIR